MQINVQYLENLRLQALFDDFNVISDQPIRYKGDGTAPGPYDYFLASSAMCAAYFVKVYCNARDIPTDEIKLSQNNIIDPENRYKQTFDIQIELPESISEKDKKGIIAAMDRCTVKRVIQNNPDFIIKAKSILGKNQNSAFSEFIGKETETMILGKDSSLEQTIDKMTSILNELDINIEVASWRNLVPHVWSVHIRDADSPMCYTNGKGATKEAALCSALGEYLERISNNYFYNDYYLGSEVSNSKFVHYPDEAWFKVPEDDSIPEDLMDDYLKEIYSNDGELCASHLIDTNSGDSERGICSLPYTRQSDQKKVYIPVNLIGNLFVSNGMSAGNTKYEARVQALAEVLERAVKNQIILEQISLPDVPCEIIQKYPKIDEGIKKLKEQGFKIYVKDASLGGIYPLICVTLMNPKNGGVFASFGAHPKFEIALERSLTELLQGRSFEGMKDTLPPSFNEFAITEHNNIVDHFIDSTGVISWKFFNSKSEYEFKHWNHTGSTKEEFDFMMNILKDLNKDVYIADYDSLGACACRILVPDYSEIYKPEDLIWDNHNRALGFREDILNIHTLCDTKLHELLENLEESELDNYMPLGELIGVAFDDNSTWAECDIGELKCLINLSLKNFEEAKMFVEQFQAFNDNLPERKKFYQLLNVVLDITLQELKLSDYKEALSSMYGEELVDTTFSIIKGDIRFYGLTKTDMNLAGLDKHNRLIESYKKLQRKRAEVFDD